MTAVAVSTGADSPVSADSVLRRADASSSRMSAEGAAMARDAAIARSERSSSTKPMMPLKKTIAVMAAVSVRSAC